MLLPQFAAAIIFETAEEHANEKLLFVSTQAAECWLPTISCLSAVQGHFIFLLSWGSKPAFILRCILCQSNHTISKQLRFMLGLHERNHIFRTWLMAPEGQYLVKRNILNNIFLYFSWWHYYRCPHSPPPFACLHPFRLNCYLI